MQRAGAVRAGCVVGLAALVFACGGGGRAPGPVDTGLVAGDFVKIATNGIDDRINSYPWAVELFDGDGDGTPEVYIGTLCNALCMQAGVIALPPERWLCPNGLWSADDIRPFFLACLTAPTIFRGTYSESTASFTWERVFEPEINQVFGFRGATVFDGALYMLGGTRLGAVWKSTNGTDWTLASHPSMGIEGGYRGAVEFKGRLYISSDAVCQLYSSDAPSPTPGAWVPANSRGFAASGGTTTEKIEASGAVGSATAQSLTSDDVPEPQLSTLATGTWRVRITSGVATGQDRVIVGHDAHTLYVEQGGLGAVFDTVPEVGDTFEIYDPAFPDHGPSWTLEAVGDYLYASTANPKEGPTLWRSSNPGPGNWEKVVTGGYHRLGKSVYASLREFKGDLMIGSLSYPLNYDMSNPLDDAEACEVLRLDPNDNVEVLVGDDRDPGTAGTNGGAPLSGLEAGFGQPTNLYVWRSLSHSDGWFYAATCDFAHIVRDYADADTGLIPPEYAGLINLYVGPSGFDLWRTQDGITWTKVTDTGFGAGDNYGIRNFLQTPWGLLVCVANAVDGFQLWMGNKSD